MAVHIRRLIGVTLLAGIASASFAQHTLRLVRLTPSELEWSGDPGSAERAAIAGSNEEAGLYAYRTRFPKGFRNAPHYHPDDRVVTVLAGTLQMGYGEHFHEQTMRALPPGSVWTEPAGQPHYVWARDGEVVIQVVGLGPSATTPVEP